MANEEALIRQTINYYAEGGTTGNPQLVAKAFHPSASMKFIKDAIFIRCSYYHIFICLYKRGLGTAKNN